MDKADNIRLKLHKYNLSFVWLNAELSKRGISCDKSELSSIFAGSRTGAKAVKAIDTSEQIVHEYEQHFIKRNYD